MGRSPERGVLSRATPVALPSWPGAAARDDDPGIGSGHARWRKLVAAGLAALFVFSLVFVGLLCSAHASRSSARSHIVSLATSDPARVTTSITNGPAFEGAPS